MKGKFPKLKNVEKNLPPHCLNEFSNDFAFKIGKQITYLLATKSTPSVEGPEWESIFANAIGAQWLPSNVGLDDVVLKNCAWGAKSVKHVSPWTVEQIRLICGRNSPIYSFGSTLDKNSPPQNLGDEILSIWNARVDQIRCKYEHARTVVLIKSSDLLKLTIFELELHRFDPLQVEWTWNKRGNLEGKLKGFHKFTWQPHGSQFTIKEDVPAKKLCLQLKFPPKINEEHILSSIGFNKTWIEII
ncbi:MAG: hypothetical protein JSR57_08275 [Verrucomicrobia bacterium]|nr:hypothetical protein [Verrucomicrobiota bacterium]